jgi:hypothetical protein
LLIADLNSFQLLWSRGSSASGICRGDNDCRCPQGQGSNDGCTAAEQDLSSRHMATVGFAIRRTFLREGLYVGKGNSPCRQHKCEGKNLNHDKWNLILDFVEVEQRVKAQDKRNVEIKSTCTASAAYNVRAPWLSLTWMSCVLGNGP